MLSDAYLDDALKSFYDDGWISEALYQVKSGKEATVYCCRAGEAAEEETDAELLAVKIYREFTNRSFKNDAIYQAGRAEHAHSTRIRRALQKRSRFGKKAQHVLWLAHEWEMMKRLYKAEISVPKPITLNEYAIIMEYIGDADTAAPPLLEAELTDEQVATTLETLLRDITHMVDLHVVHGDLSPYNILWWNDQPRIIDFPQAVDPRLNPAALELLTRDVEQVCNWAHRAGIERDHIQFTHKLWMKFTEGQLG